ncbi:DHA2 family efflux MFS transporter permease subunit [Thermocrinis minervae]|uniref:MFS transporter, DHA2 family, multidrug resistance protein n=1 Tax=Thermocrinis minervae TaxID=381751 RepID=A0A1M6QUQ8_9AQUI|nr:DHA2 family efflux MFS transporter permease subunit [Thermocrinis minervae]SHK24012.1 MFS transporter, DHA2 family, multidrug resistance protein [Thermocrinis minervae]
MVWFYTFLVVLGTFLAVLGITSTNVAIPKMIAPLETDVYGIEWVSISYIVATAITILVFNYVTSRIGLKKTYILGLFLFSLGSALSGQAANLEQMIAFRFLQGIGEGLLIPSSQSILFNLFPPEKRGTAMGFYAMAVAFAPGLGPTVGGYMVEYFSWRWIFYMNVPIVLLLIPIAYFMLPDIGAKVHVRFNPISFIFLAGFSVAFVVFLSKGESWGWFYSFKTFWAFSLALLCLMLFALSELTSENKLIDYSLFKHLDYVYAFITFIVIYGFVFFQTIYLLPIYLENLKGVPTFQAGITFLGFALMLGLFALVGGRLSDRVDSKFLLLISQTTLFIVLFFFLSHVDYYTPKWKVFVYMSFVGFAMGFFFAPLTALAFKSLAPHQIPAGSALYNYARLMGASLATSIGTYIYETRRAFHFDQIDAVKNSVSTYGYLDTIVSLSDLEPMRYRIVLAKFQEVVSGTYAIQDALRIASLIALSSIFITLFFLLLGRRNRTV